MMLEIPPLSINPESQMPLAIKTYFPRKNVVKSKRNPRFLAITKISEHFIFAYKISALKFSYEVFTL